MIPTIDLPCKCIEVPSKDTPGSVVHHSTISPVIHHQRHSKNGSIFEPGLVIRRFLWTQWHASNRFLWIQWSWGSIYIHPELMGEVELVKFTTYMVILDGGSVWKFWPYWSIFSWIQPYTCTRMKLHIHTYMSIHFTSVLVWERRGPGEYRKGCKLVHTTYILHVREITYIHTFM